MIKMGLYTIFRVVLGFLVILISSYQNPSATEAERRFKLKEGGTSV